MSNIPEDGYSRLPDVIGDRKARPPIKGYFPMSKSRLYAGIKEGVFPKPVTLGTMSYWRNSDLRELAERMSKGEVK